MQVFQAMKQVIGFEVMKLFFHVQTCFCVSTLARAVMRLVSPGEDRAHADSCSHITCILAATENYVVRSYD